MQRDQKYNGGDADKVTVGESQRKRGDAQKESGCRRHSHSGRRPQKPGCVFAIAPFARGRRWPRNQKRLEEFAAQGNFRPGARLPTPLPPPPTSLTAAATLTTTKSATAGAAAAPRFHHLPQSRPGGGTSGEGLAQGVRVSHPVYVAGQTRRIQGSRDGGTRHGPRAPHGDPRVSMGPRGYAHSAGILLGYRRSAR